jgi:hypothetical protein
LFLCCERWFWHCDDDPGRDVRDAHRRIGRVDVLPARARRAIGVDAQVALVDLDIDIVVDHRIDPDAGEAGVAARGAVIGADADEAVDAAFGLGIAIGVLALDSIVADLMPACSPEWKSISSTFIAVALGPARVHALEHAGPVLALGAAGAGIDLDIGVVGVGLAGEQRLDLVLLGALGELGERGGALVAISSSPSASAISISSTVSAARSRSRAVAPIASSRRRRSRITSCAALGSFHSVGSSTRALSSSSRRSARSQSRKRRSSASAALICRHGPALRRAWSELRKRSLRPTPSQRGVPAFETPGKVDDRCRRCGTGPAATRDI